MTSGIYKIKSLKCGKCYWGSSKNIYNRFATHRYCLNKKKHGNKTLQSIYDEYGLDNLQFEIVEECSCNDLEQREKYYLDKDENKINIWINPYSPKGCKRTKKRIWSQEVKDKISKSVRESHLKHGHPLLGVSMKEETKRKIGNANRGNKWSEESKLKIKGRASPNKGIPLSEETKLKLKLANLGKPCKLKGFVKEFPKEKVCIKCKEMKNIQAYGFSGKWYRNMCRKCKELHRKPRNKRKVKLGL